MHFILYTEISCLKQYFMDQKAVKKLAIASDFEPPDANVQL